MPSAHSLDAPQGMVPVVAWPHERAVLDQMVGNGTPCLVLVEAGHEPPELVECYQDWMWKDAGEREIRIRSRQLALRALAHGRARPYIDGYGMLHVGLRSVHLPPKERRLMAFLIARFNRVVHPELLIRSAWPDGVSRTSILANRLARLRSRVAWLGLDIVGSSATGFVLLAANGDRLPEAAGGFEAELELPGRLR